MPKNLPKPQEPGEPVAGALAAETRDMSSCVILVEISQLLRRFPHPVTVSGS